MPRALRSELIVGTTAFSATITGGTLSATAAGFDPGSFPASTNSASPAALNFTGTAGATLGDIEITFVATDDHGASATLIFTIAIDRDRPDDGFIDLDGDVIDGSEAAAIFVDIITGNDANPGTKTSPLRTIQAGIAAAFADIAKTDVYISEGTYVGNLTLADGINIYGGYSRNKTNAGAASPNAWGRSNSYITRINGTSASIAGISGCVAIRAENLTLITRLDRLTITAANAINSGENSYGIFARDCTDTLIINRCTLTAGNGANGAAGSAGFAGGPGVIGDDALFKNRAFGGPGSTGGFDGGEGGRYFFGGIDGLAGSGPAGGAGGATVSIPQNPVSNGNGGDGLDGGDGVAGNPGLGADSAGAIINGIWRPNAGATGANGTGGSGGGGGGAILNGTSQWYSGSGGGGGGGAGLGGNGGAGGGGSFALYLINSTPTLANCTLQSGNGGAGGSGGAGGIGGNGGTGGDITGAQFNVLGFIWRAGQGGIGGTGGDGGAGGGGQGGASFAIFRADASSDFVDAGNNTLQPGSPGTGGTSPAGGPSNGAIGPTGQKNW